MRSVNDCVFRAAVRAGHCQFAAGQGREFGEPCSADRTRSPTAVSRKREYFKYPPETISDFAPTAAGFGARRLIADSQKPAIGGHFSAY
jgi:hypothetical protein